MAVKQGDLADQVPPPRAGDPSRPWWRLAGAAWSRLEPIDHLLIGLTLALSVSLGVAIQTLGHGMHVDDHGLDLVIDTVSVMVTGAIAALAWIWFREHAIVDGLLRAAAFLVAAIANVYALLLVGLHAEDVGLDLLGAGQMQLWVTTMGRLLAAVLLVAPAVPLLRRTAARHPMAMLVVPSLLLVGWIAVLRLGGPILPPLSDPFDPDMTGSMGHLPASTPLGGIVQAGIAVLYLAAAVVTRDSYRRSRSVGDRYIAVALVFAAFGQFALAFYPGTFPGLVGLADVLRMAFDLTLLLAVQAEASALLRHLESANRELELLRQAEAERAALQERARLSRELHDGLAQDLWLAKLKASRLAALPELPPEAAHLCGEVQAAVDSGLTEAQAAVTALRMDPAEGERPFGVLLANYADDFADRFGIRVELSLASDLPELPTRTEAELLRITQEALTNVRRHADATVVWVDLATEDGALLLRIRDNGRGFELSEIGEASYGLRGMRERATLVGASLTIESQPSAGTTVTISIPVDVPAGAGRPS